MFIKSRHILLVTLFTCSILSCHKYKYDKFISLKQPYKRLIGVWVLTDYIVNGADSTANYFATAPINCMIEFKGEKFNGYGDYYMFNNNCITKNHLEYIAFSIKGNKLNISWYFPGHIYTIIKLYQDDWWIQSEKSSKSYVLKFKKII